MTQKDLFATWAREEDAVLGAKSAGAVILSLEVCRELPGSMETALTSSTKSRTAPALEEVTVPTFGPWQDRDPNKEGGE